MGLLLGWTGAWFIGLNRVAAAFAGFAVALAAMRVRRNIGRPRPELHYSEWPNQVTRQVGPMILIGVGGFFGVVGALAGGLTAAEQISGGTWRTSPWFLGFASLAVIGATIALLGFKLLRR